MFLRCDGREILGDFVLHGGLNSATCQNGEFNQSSVLQTLTEFAKSVSVNIAKRGELSIADSHGIPKILIQKIKYTHIKPAHLRGGLVSGGILKEIIEFTY